MKKLFVCLSLFVLAAFFFTGILSAQEKINSKLPIIIVVEMDPGEVKNEQGVPDTLGMTMFLSNILYQSGRFNVIFPDERDAKLKEMGKRLASSGDDAGFAEVGSLLGAQYIVTGKIYGTMSGVNTQHTGIFGTHYYNEFAIGLSFNIVLVETGEVAFSTQFVSRAKVKTTGIPDNMPESQWEPKWKMSYLSAASWDGLRFESTERIWKAFPLTGEIQRVEDKKRVYVSTNLTLSASAKKVKFEVMREGEKIVHPSTGEEMPGPLEKVGEVEIKKKSKDPFECTADGLYLFKVNKLKDKRNPLIAGDICKIKEEQLRVKKELVVSIED